MNDSDARQQRAKAQEQRAIDAITSIFAGGDLASETLALSNEFTDAQAARIASRIRRRPNGDAH